MTGRPVFMSTFSAQFTVTYLLRAQQRAVRAIEDVGKAIAIEVDQHFVRLAIDVQVVEA